ncbi:hypothetical protein [Nocardiopsis potens]|uniref:hypothetical protein n=1 Tax=Nocardiopsis potens TaxID=1246458 RepID=UPI0003615085|nr:hypothetical protein [Nocardiopsis potens]
MTEMKSDFGSAVRFAVLVSGEWGTQRGARVSTGDQAGALSAAALILANASGNESTTGMSGGVRSKAGYGEGRPEHTADSGPIQLLAHAETQRPKGAVGVCPRSAPA